METHLDARRSEAFARRMTSQLNEAMLAIMTSIAHQTGLFDVVARLPPSTSQAIATAAGLDERYVREWLAAMVTGRIVDYDGVRRTYHLPAEHAAHLTRSAGPGNLAGRAQWVAALAQLEAAVVACFRSGGGLDPSAFARALEIERDDMREQEEELIEEVVARFPDIAARLEAGVDVLHLRRATSTGISAMAARFTNSRHVEVPDAATFAGMPEQDLVTAYAVVHDHPDPARLLRAIHTSLRPGGHLVCVETAASSNLADNLDHPSGSMLYSLSTLRSLPASRAGHGAALGVMWGEERARQMVAEAGFESVRASKIGRDAGKNCFVARRT